MRPNVSILLLLVVCGLVPQAYALDVINDGFPGEYVVRCRDGRTVGKIQLIQSSNGTYWSGNGNRLSASDPQSAGREFAMNRFGPSCQ